MKKIFSKPVLLGLFFSFSIVLTYHVFVSKNYPKNKQGGSVFSSVTSEEFTTVDYLAGETVTFPQVKGESDVRQLVKSPVEITNSGNDLTPLQVSTGEGGTETGFLAKFKNYAKEKGSELVAWVKSDGDIGTKGDISASGEVKADDIKIGDYIRIKTSSDHIDVFKEKNAGKYGWIYATGNAEDLYYLDGSGDTHKLTGVAETSLQSAFDQGGTIELSSLSGDLRIINEAGDEILFLDESTGYVGIGTTNPEDLLTIIDRNDGGGISIKNPDDTSVAFIGSNGLSDGVIRLYDGDEDEPLIYLEADSIRDSWINTGGDFGIGTTNPEAKLHVVGGFHVDVGTFGSVGITTPDGASGISIRANDSEQARADIRRKPYGLEFALSSDSGPSVSDVTITNSGDLGIGTTSPVQILHIATDEAWKGMAITTTNTNPTAYIGSDTDHHGAIYLYDNSTLAENIALRANSNAPSWINGSGGNLGIGTSEPTEALDVNADTVRVRSSKTPATQTEDCNQGEIAWDADYIYICTADDYWERVGISSTW